jgi:hypothetical protein
LAKHYGQTDFNFPQDWPPAVQKSERMPRAKARWGALRKKAPAGGWPNGNTCHKMQGKLQIFAATLLPPRQKGFIMGYESDCQTKERRIVMQTNNSPIGVLTAASAA